MRFLIKSILRELCDYYTDNTIIIFVISLTTLTALILFQKCESEAFLLGTNDSTENVATTYYLQVDLDSYSAANNNIKNETYMLDVGMKMFNEMMQSGMCVYTFNNTFLEKNGFDIATINKLESLSSFQERIPLCKVSENAFKGIGFELAYGRGFNEADFNSSDTANAIPIILGNKYSDIFNLGETLVYSDETGRDKVIVVGFLKSDIELNCKGLIQNNIDDIMIIPLGSSFPRTNCIETNNNIEQNRVSSMLHGYLYCSDKTIAVQSKINDYTSKYGFYCINVQPLNGVAAPENQYIVMRNQSFYRVAIILISLTSILLVGVVLDKRVQKEEHICSDYSDTRISIFKTILLRIIEFLILIIISSVIVTVIDRLGLDNMLIPIWQILLYELLIMVISEIPIIRSLLINYIRCI